MSKALDIIETNLLDRFGKDDIIKDYVDSRYPLGCKFYVKSSDLFIETFIDDYRYSYHWFSTKNNHKCCDGKCDEVVAGEWKVSNNPVINARFIEWTKTNTQKRLDARKNNLNYFVCWDNKEALDFLLYQAMDYPDAHDWKKEFSWLKTMKLKPGKATFECPASIKQTNVCCWDIVRYFQQDTLYQREIELFNSDKVSNKGRIQGQVLSYCYRWLKKLPHQLSQEEIYMMIGKYQLIDSYSLFDNKSLIYLIDQYNIKSMVNLCAGWMERIITCKYKDVEYWGIDNNDALEKGYQAAIEKYDMKKQHFVVGNCSKARLKSKNTDCVLFTPPYWNREIYTSKSDSAENLASYEEYLKWFKKSLENSIGKDTKVVAYTMSTYLGKEHNIPILEDTDKIVRSLGWQLKERIPVNQNKQNENRINKEYLNIYEI